MDNYNIDGQKLMYHPRRVADWREGKTISPIYVEISPTSACNQKCTFCGLDFAKDDKVYLHIEQTVKTIKEMGTLGVKSIMFAGEGEPLMHPDIVQMVAACYKSGIDVAITTNGVLLTENTIRALMPYLTWIRVSINGASANTYKQVHRRDHFSLVIENVHRLRTMTSACTVGLQFIVLPENEHEIEAMKALAIELNVDYLAYKPFSQHPQMKCKKYKCMHYSPEVLKRLAKVSGKFEWLDVIYREQAFGIANAKTPMQGLCYALPFWSYVDSKGDVWSCSVWIGDQNFYRGSIYKFTAKHLWKNHVPNLRAIITTNCRTNCRMVHVNQYLANLENGVKHETFV